MGITTEVDVAVADGVARLRLENPPLNLVTVSMLHALDRALVALAEDAQVRCLVVSGAGDRAFCAGSDVSEFDRYREPHAAITEKMWLENVVYQRLSRFRWPTIAQIDGVAFGGGLELAVCCDLAYAAQSARFALPEVRLGVFPGSGGTVRVTRRIGPARVKRMMFFGDAIDAATALDWGLVDAVFDEAELKEAVTADAVRLAAGPESLSLMKRAVEIGLNHGEEDAVTRTLPLIEQAFRSTDCQEGIAAFREKRPPDFPRARMTAGLARDGAAE